MRVPSLTLPWLAPEFLITPTTRLKVILDTRRPNHAPSHELDGVGAGQLTIHICS